MNALEKYKFLFFVSKKKKKFIFKKYDDVSINLKTKIIIIKLIYKKNKIKFLLKKLVNCSLSISLDIIFIIRYL
jgi:hypothetical protein